MFRRETLAIILPKVDFGNSVAEHDNILQTARVDTSVFSDSMKDRVDLIPGTKGSGKSALFRIFTDFLPEYLVQSKKIAVAHGVYSHGDSVFRAFEESFEKLTENEFVDFWCIYLVKIARSDFISNPKLKHFFTACRNEIVQFENMCHDAGILSEKPHKTFRELVGSALVSLAKFSFSPTVSINTVTGVIDVNFAGNINLKQDRQSASKVKVPIFIDSLKVVLDEILRKSNLRLWLMIDRLDEIFPRRSQVETRALRGLLRAMREIGTRRIVVKIFLRDDILAQVTAGGKGFTALSHITSRKADKLRWSEEQILTLIVKRLYANEEFLKYAKVSKRNLESDQNYRTEVFYRVFPKEMHDGTPTLRWIYEHTMDGQGVVTPRDIIELLTRANQRQQDDFNSNSEGSSGWIIGPDAIRYGFEGSTKHKKDTLLKAEYPHLWNHMKKFEHGKISYTRAEMISILGNTDDTVLDDLVSIGFLGEQRALNGFNYNIPHLYRTCLEITKG